MNVTIVAGYGDKTDYIERYTASWPEKYGLEPHIHAFGTTDLAETYEQHWQEFESNLKEGPIIGISFGFSIAARALLEHPDTVGKIISISGPHDLSALNPVTVENKYPMIGKSLAAFDHTRLPASKIMTIRPLKDGVISPEKVMIDGATNIRVPMIFHGPGIAAALKLKGGAISKFLEAT